MMGVATLDELPRDQELPPPSARCCHWCMRRVGGVWLAHVHDDLSLWKYPYCWRCYKIGIGGVSWEECRDEVERRVWIQAQDAHDNLTRFLEMWRGRSPT